MESQTIPMFINKRIPIQIGNKSINLPLYSLKNEYYVLQSDLVVQALQYENDSTKNEEVAFLQRVRKSKQMYWSNGNSKTKSLINNSSQYQKFLTLEGIKYVLIRSPKCKQPRTVFHLFVLELKKQGIEYKSNLPQFTGEYFKLSETVQLPIFGTTDVKLFISNDILVQGLKYEDLSKVEFFKELQNNSQFVLDPSQSDVNNQLEFSITGEEIKPLYFTEDSVNQCLMRSQKQEAMEFKDSILLFFKDVRKKKIQVTYNEDSEFQANRRANPNVFIDALTGQNSNTFNIQLDDIEDLVKSSIQDYQQCINQIKEIVSICNSGQSDILKRTTRLLNNYYKIEQSMKTAEQAINDTLKERNLKEATLTVIKRNNDIQTPSQPNRNFSIDSIVNNTVASQNRIMINLPNQNKTNSQVPLLQSQIQETVKNPQVICPKCQSKVLKQGLKKHQETPKCQNMVIAQ